MWNPGRRMRGSVSLESIVNILSVVTLTAVLALVTRSMLARPSSSISSASSRPSAPMLLEGMFLDSLRIRGPSARPVILPSNGRPRAIYLFHTKCKACAAQYKLIARELASLPRGSVVTGSVEADTLISGYWASAGVLLPTPVSFISDDLARFSSLRYTPTLLLLDSRGIVSKHFVGADTTWRPGRLSREFANIR